VLKVFADRPQDWLDIEGIVVRQRARLNRALVIEELEPLLDLKDDTETLRRPQALFRKHVPPDV
jgi:hypothetical protein